MERSPNNDRLEWLNREVGYVLRGTAAGTVFEGETWVNELLAAPAYDNVVRIIARRFEGRFSFAWPGLLCQTGRASWDEKYGLMALFNRGTHRMYMPVNARQLSDSRWAKYPQERLRLLKRGSLLAYLSRMPDGQIELLHRFRKPANGNQEDDEPEIWMQGIYDKRGHLTAPFALEEIESC